MSRVAERARAEQAVIATLVVAVLLLGRPVLAPALDSEALRTWATMFIAIATQSMPFLVGGVLLSAAISTLVSERMLERVVPRDPRLAVPAAGLAGVCLPGCECAAVPVANGLMRQGVAPAAALTFLLAAPAVNPAVIASTAVAFSGRPEMVLARFLASLATAVVVGWVWLARGREVPITVAPNPTHGTGWSQYLGTVRHDFLHSVGFVMIGAMIAAAINTLVPRSIVDSVGGHLVASVLAMALFAFVVALCSESDAFVAASLTAFSDTAKLVFLVVGPAMDVKLAAQEAGQFGMAFAARFVPLVLGCAVVCACLAGWWLL
ncbi:MAG: permease [Nocardioides sp.]|uniref:permease n=1 Tax=Nocardioides sp. TaxID=35761 RepID=UPI0039E4B1E5